MINEMDAECVRLCAAVNLVPGITTTGQPDGIGNA